MAKKISKKAGVKRSRRVNKKIPLPMSHLGESLTIWGLDSREWLDDPLIWSLRGRPNATMPVPTWGWFAFDGGRYHQVNQPYGSQLPEPENIPNTPSPSASPQMPVYVTGDTRDGHNVPRYIDERHGPDGTRYTMPIEWNGGTSPISNSFPPTTFSLSQMFHDIMGDMGEGDSNDTSSTTTTPENYTSSDSVPYTTSPSSISSGDQVDDATSIYGSTPSHMASNNVAGVPSNPAPPHIPSNSTTFQTLQQQYFPSSVAQISLPTGPVVPTSTLYTTGLCPPYHQPTPIAGQIWSQSMAYPSHGGVSSSHPSAPPVQTTYSNMADHSLAPMIPHVSAVRNRRDTHSTSHIRGSGDGGLSGSSVAGPSRASRAPQRRRSPHLDGAASHNHRRRIHTMPVVPGTGQASRGISATSNNYGWGTSYIGNGRNSNVNNLNLTAGSDISSGGNAVVEYPQNSAPPDGMPRWDPYHSDSGFTQ